MKPTITKPNIIFYVTTLVLMTVFFHHQNIYAMQDQKLPLTPVLTEYKGIILDKESKKPLIYTNLNITNTNISTVTNTDGEFLIKVPELYLKSSVIISHLGYNDLEISLSELNNPINHIYLNEAIITLNEVNLKTIKNAEALVRETLKRKGDNYYNNHALMTAFYRETIKKRNRNASLSEAVVEVYKQPLKSNKNDAVKLIKARKSTDYSKLDTLALKLQGGPFSNLYTDMMKYPEFIFNEDNLSDYIFSYAKTSQINGSEVFVIDFKQQPYIKYPMYYGKLFIDTKSRAITSAVYKLNVTNKILSSEMFVKKKPNRVDAYPTEASYRVDYRIKDGKWHYGYSNIALTFKVKWKHKLFNSSYTLSSEMAITDWEENTSGIDRPKERLKPSVILSDQASGFSDPDFWGEFNIIEPEKSIESAIKKINKQLSKIAS
ncbi:hypothetical protein APS56_04430 [Pseudalgibacter alginicilyticus]|uniref:Carboxypeptidase-like regulatory domain-containing protein n=1 Tax=Pseudalgibacter alginicilyticus TaxID=1736674 RepID=A0A0P0CE99_9FLAO|nr:carboxypeptidase-like regulatory domain-containing protein [Pseudalgibacter alginicilyticus]ALJ04429.1 hypothetical protein APS56_04430 [Pseudalgibacter alginicilyticus]